MLFTVHPSKGGLFEKEEAPVCSFCPFKKEKTDRSLSKYTIWLYGIFWRIAAGV